MTRLPLRKRMEQEIFHWVVKPADGLLPPGDVCVDGSALDGPYRQLIRCGWAFVIIDDDGNITVAARGVPPRGSMTSEGLKGRPSSRQLCVPSLA